MSRKTTMRAGACLLAIASAGVLVQPAFAQSADTASTVEDVEIWSVKV